MSKAKVSIIVPIYNVESYLPKCLESLTNQTFKDIEIWAVSDGSPDNSVEIIKKYAKKDKRIKCIEKENGGYGSVLEYAIKNITTDYFLVCDPDDWLREDAIEILYKNATENKLDIAFGSYYYVYSNDNETKYTDGSCFSHVFKPVSNKVYEGEEVFKFSFLTPSPHAKLYRTKIAKNIEFPHKISFTDYILYIVSLMNSKRVMHIDEGLAYYLIDREGNSMSDNKPKIGDFHYKVFTSIIKQYQKQKNIKFDSFYYRMFLHFIFINSEITKIPTYEDYKEKRNLSYEILQICSNNRKKIYPYLKYENPKRKIVLRLLLNPLTSKMTFLYISNKNYKKLSKKRNKQC